MRHNARNEYIVQRPTLFPFLSVLVCLIGVLMFLATAVALTSLEQAMSNVELEIEWDKDQVAKKPILLECTSNGARCLESGVLYTEGKGSEQNNEKPFSDLLEALGDVRQEEYVMLLVRPDGIGVFQELRFQIVRWNQEHATNTVDITGRFDVSVLDNLPAHVKQNFSHADGKLSYVGKMDRNTVDILKPLLLGNSLRESLEKLYQESQNALAKVDYGTELIPRHWNIEASQESPTPDVQQAVVPAS